MHSDRDTADVLIVGGGAAGLAAALFCRRAAPQRRIVCVDGARAVGAKILVSGGARCNVTNRVVTDADFWGGDRRIVRHVLRSFSVHRTISFFEGLGVGLLEEADGKLFPETNRARTVLDALLHELRRVGAELHLSSRIEVIERSGSTFVLRTDRGREYAAA